MQQTSRRPLRRGSSRHVKSRLEAKAANVTAKELQDAVTAFNIKPKDGMTLLVKAGIIDGTAKAAASFLVSNPGLSKRRIGEYVGANGDFNQKVLKELAAQLRFGDMHIDVALRKFLSCFRLPGEAQQIDRVISAFAENYFLQNQAITVFKDVDAVHIMAFSLVLLNTDLHNPNLKEKQKMTLEGFVRNNRGINSGKDLPRALLESLYRRIKDDKLTLSESDMNESEVVTFMAPQHSGWLRPRSEKTFGGGWRGRKWFLLSNHVLYYFDSVPADAAEEGPKAIIPLEGVLAEPARDRRDGTVFVLRRKGGGVLKMFMPGKAGSAGQHTSGTMMLRADTREQRDEWLKAFALEGGALLLPDFEAHERALVNQFDAILRRKKLQQLRGTAHCGPASMEGWLSKRGVTNPSFQERYFLLYDRPSDPAFANDSETLPPMISSEQRRGHLPPWAKPQPGDSTKVLELKALVALPVGDPNRISLEELGRRLATLKRVSNSSGASVSSQGSTSRSAALAARLSSRKSSGNSDAGRAGRYTNKR